MAMHDWASQDMQVAKAMVGPPSLNKLDDDIVHLPKKERHGTTGP
jgi:hypothetical protein